MTDLAKNKADVSGENLAHFPSRDRAQNYGWLGVAHTLAAADGGANGGVVRASLIGVKGSAPREIGTMMLITADDIFATIGGGTLEYEVMAMARKMLAESASSHKDSSAFKAPDLRWERRITNAALGPDMGQCCGGNVRVLLELLTLAERDYLRAKLASHDANTPINISHPLASGDPLNIAPADTASGLARDKSAFIAPLRITKDDLFLYGAGHVGRALVGHLAALECDVHWVDIDASRFPPATHNSDPADHSGHAGHSIRRVIAADPTIIARHASAGAIHLVMTHDHALDQAICHTVLAHGDFARLGLIGSQTKAVRFRKRLTEAGIAADMLDRLICPIGLAEITGKAPPRVALSIAAKVAVWQQEIHAQRDKQTAQM